MHIIEIGVVNKSLLLSWTCVLIFIIFFRVVINADAPYIKMVSEQFDRSHGTLLQYVEFLCSSVTPALAYAQLIPSLDELVHQYHLDPEVSSRLPIVWSFVAS